MKNKKKIKRSACFPFPIKWEKSNSREKIKAIPKIYGRNPLCTVHNLSAGHTVMKLHHFYISMSSNHLVYIEQDHGHPLKVSNTHEFHSTENVLHFLWTNHSFSSKLLVLVTIVTWITGVMRVTLPTHCLIFTIASPSKIIPQSKWPAALDHMFALHYSITSSTVK